ncbi:MAG: cysteine-rich KTR domain-containing protein [Oscillospiraceae bacterium]|nr:cysteine-rich KTR domain-containing protein [Oscillospiraceae bacterium]
MCKHKPQVNIREDTALINCPFFCPKRKQEKSGVV